MYLGTQEPPLRFLLPCFAEHGSTVEGATGAFVPMKPESRIPEIKGWESNLKSLTRHAKKDRFWSSIVILDSNSCWEWKKSQSRDGYGKFSVYSERRKITVRAHRYAAMVRYGAITAGFLVCHSCDNPRCCNPHHLFVGTSADNNKDMIIKGRSKQLKGQAQPMSKLCDAQVLWIKTNHPSNDRSWISSTAKRLGVTRTTITNIVKNHTWKHISLQ